MKKVFRFQADGGRPVVTDTVDHYLLEIGEKCQGKKFKVTIEKDSDTRSLRQNRYLWGVCYKTLRRHLLESRDEAYTDEELHEYFMDKFLNTSHKEVRVGGWRRVVKMKKSSTGLTTAEFADFIGHIHREAEMAGCVIPNPDWEWRD